MNWIVILMALLLAAGGGYAVFLGADINQVEHGWAHLIAGSVLVSASALLLALVAVLFKLDGLRAALKKIAPAGQPGADAFVAADQASGSSADAPYRPTAVAARKSLRSGAGAGVPVAAAGAGAVAAASGLFARHSTEPELPEPEADSAAHSAPATPEPEPEAERGPVARLPDAETLASVGQAMDAATDLPAPALEAGAEPADAETLDPLEGDWLDRALAGDVVAGPAIARAGAAPEAADEPFPEAAAEDPLHSEVMREMSFAREPAGYPAEVPPAAESGPEPAQPQREIIGRHQVADISYLMYADGSIDADDGTQVRHFSSIAALKAHFAPAG